MAAKKKEKTTEEKKQKKSPKKVQLTFSPILSAAKVFRVLLREKTIEKVQGREVASYAPAIEGLPMELVVKKGEIIEVTKDQLKELQERKHVESDEEHKQRQDFISNMESQHPETLSWDLIIAEGSNYATLLDSQNIVYNDKLLIVD